MLNLLQNNPSLIQQTKVIEGGMNNVEPPAEQPYFNPTNYRS